MALSNNGRYCHRSRAYIRAAVGDPDLTVPSPTFLLQQIYDECEGAKLMRVFVNAV